MNHYRYDPLDRLTDVGSLRRFYCAKRIANEIEGVNTRYFFEYNAQPLAQHQGPSSSSVLLATDLQKCVLHSVSPQGRQAQAYSPYGYHPVQHSLLSTLGFNGERPDTVTGHYLLGQGYRAFNPVLMRFNSPDSWSPFGKGGTNAYAYCKDPVNFGDPSGHVIKEFLRRLKLIAPSEIKTEKLIKVHTSQTQTYGPLLKHYQVAAEDVSIFLKKGNEHMLIGRHANLRKRQQAVLNEMLKAQSSLNSQTVQKTTLISNDLGIEMFNIQHANQKSIEAIGNLDAIREGLRYFQETHQIRHQLISFRLIREGRKSLLPEQNRHYWDRYFGTNAP